MPSRPTPPSPYRFALSAVAAMALALTACGGPINNGDAGRSPVVQLALGQGHACARREDGRVLCWLSNSRMQILPNPTMEASVVGVPTVIPGIVDAAEVSAGWNMTCARRTNGEVLCWGDNGPSTLGDGTMTSRGTPAPVVGLSDAVEIDACGQSFACARRASGAVVCWGAGAPNRAAGSTPTVAMDVANVTQLACGELHLCALRASGEVLCVGHNASGQLGAGTTTERELQPVAVVGLNDAVELAAGGATTCARRRGGGVVCWGDNFSGQLGDGTQMRRSTPVAVLGLDDAAGISVAFRSTCARRTNGQVFCWGNGSSGMLGNGQIIPSSPTPGAVVGLTDAAEVAAGGSLSCARRSGGQVVCWGLGLGSGDAAVTIYSSPVVVPGL